MIFRHFKQQYWVPLLPQSQPLVEIPIMFALEANAHEETNAVPHLLVSSGATLNNRFLNFLHDIEKFEMTCCVSLRAAQGSTL